MFCIMYEGNIILSYVHVSISFNEGRCCPNFFEEIVKDFTHLSMKKASIFIPSYKIVEIVISFSDFLNFLVDCVIYLQNIMSTMIYINNTDGQSMDVQHGSKAFTIF
jgi:hypothetical protein